MRILQYLLGVLFILGVLVVFVVDSMIVISGYVCDNVCMVVGELKDFIVDLQDNVVKQFYVVGVMMLLVLFCIVLLFCGIFVIVVKVGFIGVVDSVNISLLKFDVGILVVVGMGVEIFDQQQFWLLVNVLLFIMIWIMLILGQINIFNFYVWLMVIQVFVIVGYVNVIVIFILEFQ